MLFRYNWQVRDQWFDWCEKVEEEELLQERTGGVGGILRTLFHIVNAEQAWIHALKGEQEYYYPFDDFRSLEKVRAFSEQCKPEVMAFIENWSDDRSDFTLNDFTHSEVLNHLIAHEIHHIGQLSVWSRELGLVPVNANLIRRGLADK